MRYSCAMTSPKDTSSEEEGVDADGVDQDGADERRVLLNPSVTTETGPRYV